jgi:hypothetical protein
LRDLVQAQYSIRVPQPETQNYRSDVFRRDLAVPQTGYHFKLPALSRPKEWLTRATRCLEVAPK